MLRATYRHHETGIATWHHVCLATYKQPQKNIVWWEKNKTKNRKIKWRKRNSKQSTPKENDSYLPFDPHHSFFLMLKRLLWVCLLWPFKSCKELNKGVTVQYIWISVQSWPKKPVWITIMGRWIQLNVIFFCLYSTTLQQQQPGGS